jgi:hypothetical protein
MISSIAVPYNFMIKDSSTASDVQYYCSLIMLLNDPNSKKIYLLELINYLLDHQFFIRQNSVIFIFAFLQNEANKAFCTELDSEVLKSVYDFVEMFLDGFAQNINEDLTENLKEDLRDLLKADSISIDEAASYYNLIINHITKNKDNLNNFYTGYIDTTKPDAYYDLYYKELIKDLYTNQNKFFQETSEMARREKLEKEAIQKSRKKVLELKRKRISAAKTNFLNKYYGK